MLIFNPTLWTVAPLTFSLVHLPPPPSLCQTIQTVQTRQCVTGRGWGCWVLLETICCIFRFRTYKMARLPQTKNEEERGPQTDKHLPQNTFTNKHFKWRNFTLLSISLIFLRLFLCFRTYLALWLLFFRFSFDLWIKKRDGITSISTVYYILKIVL